MAGTINNQPLLDRVFSALNRTWAEGWKWHPRPSPDEYDRAVVESIAALREFAAIPDLRAIPPVLQVLTHDNPRVRDAAASALAQCAGGLRAIDLPDLEDQVRASTMQAYSWHGINATQVQGHPWPTPVLALFTMHPSGYIREDAISALAVRDDVSAALPYILLRANDWVPQVRDAAHKVIRAVLATGSPEPWLPTLGLLDRVALRQRADHAWLIDSVEALFLEARARSSLRAATTSADHGVARWAVRVAMRLPAADRVSFMSAALASTDPVARLAAAKQVRSWPSPSERTSMLSIMESDSLASIRRLALYARLDADDETRTNCLRAALLDRHPSMRHAARFYLRESMDEASARFDVPAFYRDAIAHANACQLPAAIAGLGECGTAEDVDIALPFTAHARPRVAASAVRAVCALSGDAMEVAILRWLGDARPAVSREAFRTLATRQPSKLAEQLREIVMGQYPEHAARFALTLLLSRHVYDATPDAVLASAHPLARIAAQAAQYIRRVCVSRISIGPSAAQQDAIMIAIAAAGPDLPNDVRASAMRIAGRKC